MSRERHCGFARVLRLGGGRQREAANAFAAEWCSIGGHSCPPAGDLGPRNKARGDMQRAAVGGARWLADVPRESVPLTLPLDTYSCAVPLYSVVVAARLLPTNSFFSHCVVVHPPPHHNYPRVAPLPFRGARSPGTQRLSCLLGPWAFRCRGRRLSHRAFSRVADLGTKTIARSETPVTPACCT